MRRGRAHDESLFRAVPRSRGSLLGVLALLAGCGSASDLGGGTGTDGTGTTSGTSGSGPTAADAADETSTGSDDGDDTGPPPPGPPGGDACPDLACLPCGQGLACADDPPVLEGTCCAEGDSIIQRAIGSGEEIVDLDVADGLAISCGGFGATLEDVSDPDRPQVIGHASDRCENIAFGPTLADGSRIVYLAHHGDTWVETPFVATYRVTADGAELVDQQGDGATLFEGLAWRDGWLYAAMHGGGLRAYSTDVDGVPTLQTTVDGFDNAVKVALDGDHLYVADGAGGLRVLSVADPAAPAHVGHLPMAGMARDVFVHDGQAFLAMGGDGVQVVDVSDPTTPVALERIETRGTALSVEVDDEIVAIAAWSHIAVHDRTSFRLLATERTRATAFEQDLGVAISGDRIFVGEWTEIFVLEYRPGYVAPDIWVDEQLIGFPPQEQSSRVLAVRNRGYLDLDVIDMAMPNQYSVDTDWLRVVPQAARSFELTFTPPPSRTGTGSLMLETNDPDFSQQILRIPLVARDTNDLDVGDRLTEDFAFLDPTGATDLSGLEGNVIVLAYFALF